jgi:hypothetical protein
MALSSQVNPGDPALASDYNNLRSDVLSDHHSDAAGTRLNLLTGTQGLSTGRITFGGPSGELAEDAYLFWDAASKRLGVGLGNPSYQVDVYKYASGAYTGLYQLQVKTQIDNLQNINNAADLVAIRGEFYTTAAGSGGTVQDVIGVSGYAKKVSGDTAYAGVGVEGYGDGLNLTGIGVRGIGHASPGYGGKAIGGWFEASGGDYNYGLIVASGNAGIGTTSPTQFKLQVEGGDIGTSGYIYPGTGTALQTSRYIYDDGANLALSGPVKFTAGNKSWRDNVFNTKHSKTGISASPTDLFKYTMTYNGGGVFHVAYAIHVDGAGTLGGGYIVLAVKTSSSGVTTATVIAQDHLRTDFKMDYSISGSDIIFRVLGAGSYTLRAWAACHFVGIQAQNAAEQTITYTDL